MLGEEAKAVKMREKQVEYGEQSQSGVSEDIKSFYFLVLNNYTSILDTAGTGPCAFSMQEAHPV